MFFNFEAVKFFHRFNESVEVFAGDFLDFFALTTDEGVVTVVDAVIFYFATNVAFNAVHFVNEVEVFEDLDDAIDGDRVEIDLVLLEGNFSDFVW